MSGWVRASASLLHACSACDGDYQDPERTAWAQEPAEDSNAEDQTNGRPARDDFPVERQ